MIRFCLSLCYQHLSIRTFIKIIIKKSIYTNGSKSSKNNVIFYNTVFFKPTDKQCRPHNDLRCDGLCVCFQGREPGRGGEDRLQKPCVEDPGWPPGPQRAAAREPGGRTEDECAVTRPRALGSSAALAPPGWFRTPPGSDRYGVSRAAEPRAGRPPHRGLSPRRRPGPRGSLREQYRGPPRGRTPRPAPPAAPRRGPSQRASSRRPRETAPRERARERTLVRGFEAAAPHPYLTPGDNFVGVRFLHKRPERYTHSELCFIVNEAQEFQILHPNAVVAAEVAGRRQPLPENAHNAGAAAPGPCPSPAQPGAL